MQELDLLILRDTKEAIKVLDYYVHIANSMFERIEISNIGEVYSKKFDTLASYNTFSMEVFDIRGASALNCVHFFGMQFLAYIFSKVGLSIVSLVKPEGLLSTKGGFPNQDFIIIWRKLPEVVHSIDFETGDVRYGCNCRVLIINRKDATREFASREV